MYFRSSSFFRDCISFSYPHPLQKKLNSSDRIVEWAKEHDFGLIDADVLEHAVTAKV
jgi:hypothetical protein